MTEYSESMKLAIIDGTGSLGSGLALRWAKAGHQVTIGSRDAARAANVAGELSGKAGEQISGTDNASAAMIGELGSLWQCPTQATRVLWKV